MTDWAVCPECDLPADVLDRHVMDSTHGPVEHVHLRCVQRHWLLMPTASLVTERKDELWTPRLPC